MSSDLKPAVDRLEQQLAEQLAAAMDTKKAINAICKLMGQAPRYDEDEDDRGGLSSIQADSFYGQPLATVVKTYLGMRRAAGQGSAAVSEIFDALTAGGYQFGAKNDENAKRGLRISLSKNGAFHRLPNGTYGLTEWYPEVGKRKAGGGDEGDDPSPEDPESEPKAKETDDA